MLLVCSRAQQNLWLWKNTSAAVVWHTAVSSPTNRTFDLLWLFILIMNALNHFQWAAWVLRWAFYFKSWFWSRGGGFVDYESEVQLHRPNRAHQQRTPLRRLAQKSIIIIGYWGNSYAQIVLVTWLNEVRFDQRVYSNKNTATDTNYTLHRQEFSHTTILSVPYTGMRAY